MVRYPAFAGRFYPAAPADCAAAVDELLRAISASPAIGGVAPHAGWMYSGRLAALSIASISASRPVTVIIFGAVHVLDRNLASIYPRGAWRTPLGDSFIDEALAAEVVGVSRIVRADPAVHAHEHSIEVELPFLQRLLPGVRILPIMVRPTADASTLGREVASAARRLGRRVAVLASTDMTHYGPSFGFEPHGRGAAGIRWAKEVNDRRMIELIAEMNAEEVIREAAVHQNACGAGAASATIAAARELGATHYKELAHATSAEIRPGMGEDALDSVGYTAGLFI